MKSIKLLCVHTATMAFDNHTVTLSGADHELTIRYKNREDFEAIIKGDEVEVSIEEVGAVKAPKKVAVKKKAVKKVAVKKVSDSPAV